MSVCKSLSPSDREAEKTEKYKIMGPTILIDIIKDYVEEELYQKI